MALKGMNGEQAGKRNVAAFEAFCDARETSGDWLDYIGPDGTKLHRELVADACGFGTSAFRQNGTLREAFKQKEMELRARKLLLPEPPAVDVDPKDIRADERQAEQTARLNDLEHQVAQLEIERDDLRALLAYYGDIDELISQSHLWPRI